MASVKSTNAKNAIKCGVYMSRDNPYNPGNKFDRLYTAVLTPFKDNFEVDEQALRELLRYYMKPEFRESGGIIINPEAGELFCLNREEKRRNVEIAMEECGGKMPVFAGVFDLRTTDAVKVAKDTKDEGVDGIFLMPPAGYGELVGAWNADKYPEYWIDFAKEIEIVDLPAIAHAVGPFTVLFGAGLSLGATLKMCKEIPQIVGWKMVYGLDGYRIVAKALRSLDSHVAILNAPANMLHDVIANDWFDGALSASFNYAMEPMVKHVNAWRRSDIKEAMRIWKTGLQELHDYVYSDMARLHPRYKIATWLRGLIPNPMMRSPMPKPKKEEITTLRTLLANTGLDVIPEQAVNKILREPLMVPA